MGVNCFLVSLLRAIVPSVESFSDDFYWGEPLSPLELLNGNETLLDILANINSTLGREFL